MFERFRSRMPFERWRPEILRDYCNHGLLLNDGKYVLACPPPVEASIYRYSKDSTSDIYTEISTVRQPVMVLRAGRVREPDVFDLSASPTSPDLATHFPKGRETVLKHASHYIAMEEPEAVAAAIRAQSSYL
jgi:hypothetical protein